MNLGVMKREPLDILAPEENTDMISESQSDESADEAMSVNCVDVSLNSQDAVSPKTHSLQ